MNNSEPNIVQSELLSKREMQIRERFVDEFLFDYNYTAAAVRVGYLESDAKQFGQKFKYDSYVQKLIATRMSEENEEDSEEALKRLIVRSLMKEATYNGSGSSHGARVSALSKLSSIFGMDAPAKTETKVEHSGKQQLEVNNEINFDEMDDETLCLVRKLITKNSEDG